MQDLSYIHDKKTRMLAQRALTLLEATAAFSQWLQENKRNLSLPQLSWAERFKLIDEYMAKKKVSQETLIGDHSRPLLCIAMPFYDVLLEVYPWVKMFVESGELPS